MEFLYKRLTVPLPFTSHKKVGLTPLLLNEVGYAAQALPTVDGYADPFMEATKTYHLLVYGNQE